MAELEDLRGVARILMQLEDEQLQQLVESSGWREIELS
jgi:hypothetical protein